MDRVTADTVLTDRQLLVHILQHVEDLAEILEEFRPLLARFRPSANPDALTMLQTARELRRAGRGRRGT